MLICFSKAFQQVILGPLCEDAVQLLLLAHLAHCDMLDAVDAHVVARHSTMRQLLSYMFLQ
jgi:hypothetical protein